MVDANHDANNMIPDRPALSRWTQSLAIAETSLGRRLVRDYQRPGNRQWITTLLFTRIVQLAMLVHRDKSLTAARRLWTWILAQPPSTHGAVVAAACASWWVGAFRWTAGVLSAVWVVWSFALVVVWAWSWDEQSTRLWGGAVAVSWAAWACSSACSWFVALALFLAAGLLFGYLAGVREECPICTERVSVLSIVSASAECNHRCCRTCLATYLATSENERIARMRRARTYSVRCYGGCRGLLDKPLAVFGGSEALRTCIAMQERREFLIARGGKGRGGEVVECPRMSCVGVAYRGRKNLMCFLCTSTKIAVVCITGINAARSRFSLHSSRIVFTGEHTWPDPKWGMRRRIMRWISKKLWPTRIDGIKGWRACPHCGAAIVKDGGCANMRCGLCDQTFLWGATRNTIRGVVDGLAPGRYRFAGAAAVRRHAAGGGGGDGGGGGS